MRHSSTLSRLLVAGVLGGFAAGAAAQDEMPLSALSGTWLGKRTSKALGKCSMSEPEAPALLRLVVDDEGRIEIQNINVTGTVNQSWQVNVSNPRAWSRCGEKESTYALRYSGLFFKKGDALHLELEGENTPCPPDCSFLVQYRVKKQDVEDPE